MCLCATALGRAYRASKKAVESQKTARWERARGDEVQRVRIKSQQLHAASPVASHALLEPLVDAILMVQLHPGRNTSALVGSVLFLVLAALLLSLLTVLLSHLLLGDALLLGVARVRCIQ
jgi:hypothetical protein